MSTNRLIVKNLIAASAMMLASTAAHAFDGGDPAKGEGVFKKCMSCHMVGPEAKNKVGQMLNNIIGRTAGTVEDYKYGKSIVEAGAAGLVWTEEELFAYLRYSNPVMLVP